MVQKWWIDDKKRMKYWGKKYLQKISEKSVVFNIKIFYKKLWIGWKNRKKCLKSCKNCRKTVKIIENVKEVYKNDEKCMKCGEKFREIS